MRTRQLLMQHRVIVLEKLFRSGTSSEAASGLPGWCLRWGQGGVLGDTLRAVPVVENLAMGNQFPACQVLLADVGDTVCGGFLVALTDTRGQGSDKLGSVCSSHIGDTQCPAPRLPGARTEPAAGRRATLSLFGVLGLVGLHQSWNLGGHGSG